MTKPEIEWVVDIVIDLIFENYETIGYRADKRPGHAFALTPKPADMLAGSREYLDARKRTWKALALEAIDNTSPQDFL